ncbi:MAG: beta-propeller fold lactonase family protein [Planctomycetes bacterium]|nr:beta-propeller fold lactonase family protein [Planctomycetota bacterium]
MTVKTGPTRSARPRVAALAVALAALGCKGDDAWFGSGPGAEASVTTPSGTQAGLVEVVYTLSGDVSEADIAVSYSLDGGSFREATQGPGGEGTESLSVSAAGDTHTFVWDSGADLEEARESFVVIRVWPERGTAGRSSAVTVHNGRYLAAVENRSAGRVRLYSIDAVEGDVRYLSAASTGGTDPYDVLFEDGFFFVAHSTSNDVAVLELDEDEDMLIPVEGSPFAGDGVGAKHLAADSSHLFVANVSSGTITIFDRNAGTGVLTLSPHSGMGVAGCRSLLVRSSRLYVASETGGRIVIFDIDTNGELLPNGASPVTSGGLLSPRAMVQAGARLYAANASSATLCGFTFLGDGDLSPLGGSPFAVSSSGVEQLAANGTKLFAVTGSGGSFLSFTIDSSGAVTEDAGSAFALGGPAFTAATAGAVAVAATTDRESFETWTIAASGAIAEASSSPEDALAEILRIALSD